MDVHLTSFNSDFTRYVNYIEYVFVTALCGWTTFSLIFVWQQVHKKRVNNILQFRQWQYFITAETRYFELMVTVDSDIAPLLTTGREKIEDILVLHLEGGKDFFVSF